MKVYNDEVIPLNALMKNELKRLRELRDFDLTWIDRKITLINEYFRTYNLSGAVVGLSGGLDSSVVLALLKKASEQNNSHIKRIVPMLLPAVDSVGATKQDDSIARGVELCDSLELEPALFEELSHLSNTVSPELERVLKLKNDNWSIGQLVPYLRTPILYNSCSILTTNGTPSIVVGTTNFSEGGYLGYVGKASDGMTDLQIISDLFKSEVYQVARELKLPESIINVTPTGDMYDSRVDEEVFGATYDFLELFMLGKQYGLFENIYLNEQYIAGSSNLEKLHSYNSHKYLYSYPSVFLDILPTNIPNGWNNPTWTEMKGE